MIKRLCVIGVGLIGGSLARALRKAAQVEEVVGCGRSRANLDRAVELGVIDRYVDKPADAVAGADMVVLATNLGAMDTIMPALVPGLSDDCIITDVGSAKTQVNACAQRHLGAAAARFVAGHPIAGTERSGAEASFAELFQDHRVILTPAAGTDSDAIKQVTEMWRHTGAIVRTMDDAHHDAVLAATSHLPHMLAFTLVDCLAGMDDSGEIFEFAAGGFRDFTRIASSSPEMWRDIAVDNRAALLDVCAAFENSFRELRERIDAADVDALGDMFERAKRARDQHYAAQSKSED